MGSVGGKNIDILGTPKAQSLKRDRGCLAILANNLGIIDTEAVRLAHYLSPRKFGHSNHECRSQNSELI